MKPAIGRSTAVALTLLLSSHSAAETQPLESLCGLSIDIEFREGAPRDVFEFGNNSQSGWHITSISLSLENSVGKLIFDTEEGGMGVQVFQLFEVEDGSAVLDSAALPGDGDNVLELDFSRFEAGDDFAFSIDVDDQLTRSELGQIRVADSEMAGAVVAVTLRDSAGESHSLDMVFDAESRSSVSAPEC